MPVHGADQEDFVIKGTVVGVGQKFFYPYHNEKTESPRTYWHRHYNEISLSYNCPSEIKEGDRVLFHHNANFEKYGDLLYMRRDMLYAKINDRIEAINGWVLFEVDENHNTFEDGIIIPKYDVNNYGKGRVVSKSPLGEYNDWHYEAEFEGEEIYYSKRHASRLELDFHNSLTNRQSSLFKIQRKDIYYALRSKS